MTIVNEEKKYVFIHIPKTGGQTIKKTIKNNGIGCKPLDWVFDSSCYDKHGRIRNWYHYTGGEIKENLKINLNNYTVFTFVRNPYDRFYSLYTHTKKIFNKSYVCVLSLFVLFVLLCKILPTYICIIIATLITVYVCIKFNYISLAFAIYTKPFNAFIKEHFKSIYDVGYNMYKPQNSYIEKININFIGREEHFENDVNHILYKIGEKDSTNNTLNSTNIHTLKRVNNSYKYIDKFNKETIQLVNNIYKKDFEKFNYPIISPNIL